MISSPPRTAISTYYFVTKSPSYCAATTKKFFSVRRFRYISEIYPQAKKIKKKRGTQKHRSKFEQKGWDAGNLKSVKANSLSLSV